MSTLDRMTAQRQQLRALYQQQPADFYARQLNNAGLRGAWFRQRQVAINRLVRKYSPAGRVLDICCGNSLWNTMALPVAGIDICEGMLRYTSGCQPRFQPVLADVYDGLPLRNESVAIVIISEVLEHFPDYPRVIAEIYRVLQPGGHVICSVPQGRFPGLWGVIFPLWCRLKSLREQNNYYKHQCGHKVNFSAPSLRAAFAMFTQQEMFSLWQLTLFYVARKDA